MFLILRMFYDSQLCIESTMCLLPFYLTFCRVVVGLFNGKKEREKERKKEKIKRRNKERNKNKQTKKKETNKEKKKEKRNKQRRNKERNKQTNQRHKEQRILVDRDVIKINFIAKMFLKRLSGPSSIF